MYFKNTLCLFIYLISSSYILKNAFLSACNED